MSILMLARACLVLCLLLPLSASADVVRLGRITGDVKFRESPSRSAPVLGVLSAGTEVSIRREDPGGWYLVTLRGRPGFVHKSYVNARQQRQNSAERFDTARRRFAIPAGIILICAGIILIVSVVAPFLIKTAAVLAGSLIAVVVLDLAFSLGALYSLTFAALGLLIVLLFLTRKKNNRAVSADESSRTTKKAA